MAKVLCVIIGKHGFMSPDGNGPALGLGQLVSLEEDIALQAEEAGQVKIGGDAFDKKDLEAHDKASAETNRLTSDPALFRNLSSAEIAEALARITAKANAEAASQRAAAIGVILETIAGAEQ